MKNSILKITVFMMLVVLCLWQIVTLWLGDMSSHNFLLRNETAQTTAMVQPKSVWVNVGNLLYKVDASNNEYDMLFNELRSLVISNVRRGKIEKEDNLTYEELLGKQSILYEYGMGLGIQELVGIKIDELTESEKVAVNQVFVDMNSYSEQSTTLYLVTEDLKNIYKVTLYNQLKGHQKMMESFNKSENTKGLINYKPSIISPKKDYIKGNVFFPSATKDAPIEYDVLETRDPFEGKSQVEKKEILEGYVNSFFTNPLLKVIEQESNGSIIFSEKMRAIVKYNPAGTLEFNITSANEETKLSEFERLTKVMQFIDHCTGIPKFLKTGIYLRKIISQGDEYIYKFDYKYKGFSILLSDQVKEKLGLDSILQITIKNNQIVSGKWSILKIAEPDENTPTRGTLQKGFDEIVDNMYASYIKSGSEIRKLDTVQCRYIMEDTKGRMNLAWTVFYKNHWYTP